MCHFKQFKLFDPISHIFINHCQGYHHFSLNNKSRPYYYHNLEVCPYHNLDR